jgi:hypothetical protein
MARQLRQQLDEEVEIIGKDDFGAAARRPPGSPAAGTPPVQPPAAPPVEPQQEPPRPS